MNDKPADKLQTRDNVSKSQFYMLRALITMAHADDVIRPEERAFIENMIANLPLDYNQKTILTRDLQKPTKIDELLPNITEPRFRAQIVDFARILAARDGKAMPSEEYLLQKIKADITAGVDMDQLRTEIRARVADEMQKFDDNRRNTSGSFFSRFLARIYSNYE